MSVTFCRTLTAGAAPTAGRARVREGAGIDDAAVAAALGAGLLPVETARAESPAIAWAVEPAGAMELLARGVAGLAHHGPAHRRRAACWTRSCAAGPPSFAPTPTASRRRSSSAGCPASTRASRWRWTTSAGRSTRSPPAPQTWWWATGTPGRSPRCATRSPRGRSSSAPPCRPGPRSTTPARTSRDRCSPPGSPRSTARAPPARATPGPPAATRSRRCPRGACRPSGRTRAGARAPPTRASAGSIRTWPGSSSARWRARRRGWPRSSGSSAPAAPRSRRSPRVADALRERRVGEVVTYVINRNINYTNQCYFRCGFCGFSRGPKSLNLRGDPYILNVHEVVHRSVEAWPSAGPPRSACRAASTPTSPATSTWACCGRSRQRLPQMHVHGFTAARGLAGRPHARHPGARVPHPPARRRPRHPAGHRRRDPRRPRCAGTCARTRCARPSGPR